VTTLHVLAIWGFKIIGEGMMEKIYKEYYVANIFLLVIFVGLLFSCEKNIKTPEESNNEQLSEQESTDDNKSNEDELFSDDSGESPFILRPRTPGLDYDDSLDFTPVNMLLIDNHLLILFRMSYSIKN
jgi:hypothetical protein